jgi:hypothetical protein
VRISIYVEGGGPRAKAPSAVACRKAFRLFFEKLLGDRPMPHIVASGSRDEAYRDFCRELETNPERLAILLVDSEDPVPADKTAAAYLRARDHWTKAMPDDQVHLMVQCMEAWFLADAPAVVLYYGREFREAALSGNPNIEAISKRDVMNKLESATRATAKGTYHKSRHGFDILERIDPNRVRQASRHADALFAFLLAKLT